MPSKVIHVHIHDAGYDESKHKRASNGQFGSGSPSHEESSKKDRGPMWRKQKAHNYKLKKWVAQLNARKRLGFTYKE